MSDFKPSWTISLNGTAVTVDFNSREDAERFMDRVETLDLTGEGEAAEETIVIGGRSYRKFIRYPDEVDDGTCRCIRCGQIDEPDYHDDEICRAAASPQPAQPDLEVVARRLRLYREHFDGSANVATSTGDNLYADLGIAADALTRIAALTAEVKRLGELADGYGKLDLEYALLTAKVLESEKLRGQRDAAMAKVEQLTQEIDALRFVNNQYSNWWDKADERAETAEARVAQLEEALTPSADTKAAYIGEFHMGVTLYLDGEEETRRAQIPWTSIKEIMAAIRERAALKEYSND